jgi:sugar phosphate isomerase/epimerase
VTSPNISVQLYTVRESAEQDLGATLQRLADIGFTQIEPFALRHFGAALHEALTASGLQAPTAHEGYIGQGEEQLDALFAQAAEYGISMVIDPFVDGSKWLTAEGVIDTAKQLNAAGAIAARHGVTVGYHNHAHEIASIIDGEPALELFARHLDEGVGLEIDSYWVAVGGTDPVALLRRLGDQVVAVHVKDGPGTAEPKDQVAVGSGSLPIAEIIAATPNALHVIELDDSAGDRFEAVEDSFAFLSALKVGNEA